MDLQLLGTAILGVCFFVQVLSLNLTIRHLRDAHEDLKVGLERYHHLKSYLDTLGWVVEERFDGTVISRKEE